MAFINTLYNLRPNRDEKIPRSLGGGRRRWRPGPRDHPDIVGATFTTTIGAGGAGGIKTIARYRQPNPKDILK